MSRNVFNWVEIYVEDMQRARKFYETVLNEQLMPMTPPEGSHDLEMISFPFEDNGQNISGALVKTSSVKPGMGGTLVYFTCDDCAVEISRVQAAGGQVINEKFSIAEHGFCGICIDTEGNMIGFHSMK
ncbi:MAG: VOC family protein [Saprospiraceae bacterium]|nr:VOC family protein [Saprospiraceae bacterium]